MTDVVAIVEGLDHVVGLAQRHLHPDDLSAVRRSAEAARGRAGHLGSTLVLALLGGTGAGKSSLLNAVAGTEVASVGAVRPHTTEPLAWVPGPGESSLRILLGRLGIQRVVEQDRYPGIAILDMLDVDSLVEDHRRRVEEILPAVDVAVWVFDPLKYADAVVHREFIAPNAAAADRMVFILNQVDTIPPDERTMVRDHLRDLLVSDGIAQPALFDLAARPSEGPPVGIEAFVAHVVERLDEKRIHLGRIIDDVRRAARAVAGATGIAGAGSLAFEERWDEVRSRIVAQLTEQEGGVAAFEEALRALDQLVLRLSTEAGGPFGQRIRQTFGPGRLESELQGAVDVMTGVAGPRRPADETAVLLDGQLQARIGAPLREIIWERAALSAVVTGLAVDATMAESELLGITPE